LGSIVRAKQKSVQSKFLGYTFLVYRTVFANEDEILISPVIDFSYIPCGGVFSINLAVVLS
jgi:hypothetical protein